MTPVGEGTAESRPTSDEAPPGPPGPVAIVGLGLMGGSLARTLRRRAPGVARFGIDADPVVGARALEAGVVDRFDAGGEGLIGEAGLVVYCTPLRIALERLTAHAPFLRPDAFVTDVVSLKASFLRVAHEVGVAGRTVGAHPMCGGERSGLAASREGLYEGARVILCASGETSEEARDGVAGFWRSVGGVPEWMEAGEHDRQMAWVSHLPQLVSNALAGALHAAGFRVEDLGPGGRDMTRLAGSSPELWRDLLEGSAPVAGTGLRSVTRGLQVLGDLLSRRELDRIAEFMERTRAWRNEDGEGPIGEEEEE